MRGKKVVTIYSDLSPRPVLQIAMPGSMPLGGTVHVVARCNNREFYFTILEDFKGKRAA